MLSSFTPLIQGRHILLRTDNRTALVFINRQSRDRSNTLLKLVENLWYLASEHLLYCPMSQAILMFRGGPLPEEWGLHPSAVEQIRTVGGIGGGSDRHLPQYDSPLGLDAYVRAIVRLSVVSFLLH